MATDFTIFIVDNWTLIKDNLGVFIIYGLFFFLIGFAISKIIHKNVTERKIYNLPERETLQKQVLELKEENEELKKKLRRLELEETIEEVFHGKNNHETLGDIIGRNK